MLRNSRRSLLRTLLILIVSSQAADAGFEPWDPEDWNELERRFRGRGGVTDKLADAIFDGMDDVKVANIDINSDLSVGFHIGRSLLEDPNRMTVTRIDRFQVVGTLAAYNPLAEVGSNGTLGFFFEGQSGVELVNIRIFSNPHAPGPLRYPPYNEFEDMLEESAAEKERELREFLERDRVASELNHQAREAREEKARLAGLQVDDQEVVEDDPPGGWTGWDSPEGDSFLSFIPLDPIHAAHIDDLWNLVTFPLDLPLHADKVEKLSDGEIISYKVNILAELGISLGWDFSGFAQLAEAGAAFSVYGRGDYKYTIQRLQGSKVRLKFSPTHGAGYKASLDAGNNGDYLDTFVLLKKAKSWTEVRPFKLSVHKDYWWSFDKVYEYDLAVESGREAFESALRGRFTPSDQLAYEIDLDNDRLIERDFAVTGVKKLPTRHIEGSETSYGTSLKFGFLFRAGTEARLRTVEAEIEYVNSEGKIENRETLQTIATDSSEWRLLGLFTEGKEYQFTVNLDLNEYLTNPESKTAINMTVEGKRRDSDTRGSEMIKYILETENAVGVFDIFPRPIDYVDKWDMELISDIFTGSDLGHSSFYYRLALTEEQISWFINTPEKHMSSYLSVAFNDPTEDVEIDVEDIDDVFRELLKSPKTILEYVWKFFRKAKHQVLDAATIKRKWLALQKEEDPRVQAEELGKMFFKKGTGKYMVRLVRTVMSSSLEFSPLYDAENALDISEVAYLAHGDAYFGQVRKEGVGRLDPRNIATDFQKKIREEYEFDDPTLPTYDFTRTVSPKNLKMVQDDSGTYSLQFDLDEFESTPDPDKLAVWMRIHRTDYFLWLIPHDNHLADISENGHRHPQASPPLFAEGTNTFTFDPDDTTYRWGQFGALLEPDEEYTVQIWLSQANGQDWSGSAWGPMGEITFVTLEEE